MRPQGRRSSSHTIQCAIFCGIEKWSWACTQQTRSPLSYPFFIYELRLPNIWAIFLIFFSPYNIFFFFFWEVWLRNFPLNNISFQPHNCETHNSLMFLSYKTGFSPSLGGCFLCVLPFCNTIEANSHARPPFSNHPVVHFPNINIYTPSEFTRNVRKFHKVSPFFFLMSRHRKVLLEFYARHPIH